jgi:hypothetical protein
MKRDGIEISYFICCLVGSYRRKDENIPRDAGRAHPPRFHGQTHHSGTMLLLTLHRSVR